MRLSLRASLLVLAPLALVACEGTHAPSSVATAPTTSVSTAASALAVGDYPSDWKARVHLDVAQAAELQPKLFKPPVRPPAPPPPTHEQLTAACQAGGGLPPLCSNAPELYPPWRVCTINIGRDLPGHPSAGDPRVMYLCMDMVCGARCR
jgi:hypothetical protein